MHHRRSVTVVRMSQTNDTPQTQQIPAEPAAETKTPHPDLASILNKIQQLESENSKLNGEMKANQLKYGKLQDEKKRSMEELMNNTIQKWLDNLKDADETSRAQLTAGLKSLVSDGHESGIWNVVACASSNWMANVNEIEKLTTEVNDLRKLKEELNDGRFSNEDSRITGVKRPADQMSETVVRDVWDEFEHMMMKNGGNKGDIYG